MQMDFVSSIQIIPFATLAIFATGKSAHEHSTDTMKEKFKNRSIIEKKPETVIFA